MGILKKSVSETPPRGKKSKEDFIKLVKYCISREVITKDLVRKFSKRARDYMVTYKSLDLQEEEVVGEGSGISHHKIETLLKIVKSHRSALDFDAGFVVKLVTAADFDFENEVELVSERKKAGVKRKFNKK